MTIANDLGERGSNFGRTRKRLARLKEGNGRGLSRPDRLQTDTQGGAQSRRVDMRVLGMDLRGGRTVRTQPSATRPTSRTWRTDGFGFTTEGTRRRWTTVFSL